MQQKIADFKDQKLDSLRFLTIVSSQYYKKPNLNCILLFFIIYHYLHFSIFVCIPTDNGCSTIIK